MALRGNDFEFASCIFLQTMAMVTAMGKKFAPSLPNLYLEKFEEKVQEGNEECPDDYFWYLEDIFFTLAATTHIFLNIHKHLNTRRE